MFGAIAIVVALVLGLVGLMQHLKGKRILAAPFKKTGEIAANPSSTDPKGAMSAQGEVVAAQQLFSPMSQTPCLYYEVEVTREWEKQEQTQEGVKTRSGTSTVTTLKEGCQFAIDDGSGQLTIDVRQGADFDNLTRKEEKKIAIGMFVPGELEFGALRMQTPLLPGGESTKAFKAVERIVPAGGTLFVLGKVDSVGIVKPSWRSMLVSAKGREGLLASTARMKKVGFIGAGVAAVAAIPLFIFAPALEGAPTQQACAAQWVDAQATAAGACSDQVTKEAREYAWQVTQPGRYTLTVSPVAGQTALHPVIEVHDVGGLLLESDRVGEGETVSLSVDLEPGQYQVRVDDEATREVKGGLPFQLVLARAELPAAAEPAGASEPTPAQSGEPTAAAKPVSVEGADEDLDEVADPSEAWQGAGEARAEAPTFEPSPVKLSPKQAAAVQAALDRLHRREAWEQKLAERLSAEETQRAEQLAAVEERKAAQAAAAEARRQAADEKRAAQVAAAEAKRQAWEEKKAAAAEARRLAAEEKKAAAAEARRLAAEEKKAALVEARRVARKSALLDETTPEPRSVAALDGSADAAAADASAAAKPAPSKSAAPGKVTVSRSTRDVE